MNLSLRERLGRAGRFRAIDRVSSGSPAILALRLPPLPVTIRTVSAALALAKRGMSLLQAKRAMDELLEKHAVVVDVPMVEDVPTLLAELTETGMIAATVDASASNDARPFVTAQPQ